MMKHLFICIFSLFCEILPHSISAASSGAYAYLSEFFPSHMRASSIAFASAVASISIVYMPVVGIVLNRFHMEIPITDSYTVTGWRLHMLLNLLPGVISLFFMYQLPESPKYLMSAHRDEECLHVLRTMYETNTKVSRFRFPVQNLKMERGEEEEDTGTRKSNKSL